MKTGYTPTSGARMKQAAMTMNAMRWVRAAADSTSACVLGACAPVGAMGADAMVYFCVPNNPAALAAVDQHRNATRVGDPHHVLHRHDGAEHVRHLGDGDELGLGGRSSFSNSSIRKLPSSSTGAHLRTAP